MLKLFCKKIFIRKSYCSHGVRAGPRWKRICLSLVRIVCYSRVNSDSDREINRQSRSSQVFVCAFVWLWKGFSFVNVKGPLVVLLQPEIIQQRRGNATAAVRRKQERDTAKSTSGLLQRAIYLFSGIGENRSPSPVRFFLLSVSSLELWNKQDKIFLESEVVCSALSR